MYMCHRHEYNVGRAVGQRTGGQEDGMDEWTRLWAEGQTEGLGRARYAARWGQGHEQIEKMVDLGWADDDDDDDWR